MSSIGRTGQWASAVVTSFQHYSRRRPYHIISLLKVICLGAQNKIKNVAVGSIFDVQIMSVYPYKSCLGLEVVQISKLHDDIRRRGAKKHKNSQKTEQTPRGALIYLYIKRPGAFFFALFREGGPVGRVHDARRCAKRTCYRSGKERFAACRGRNSRGILLSLHTYSSIQVFVFTFVSRPVDSTRPNQHFFLSGNAPEGAFCPIFVLKNASGTLQTYPGALFRKCFTECSGGVYSILYGIYLRNIEINYGGLNKISSEKKCYKKDQCASTKEGT